ncbi:MAG: 50S ribosomal protein L18 [Patescibacteria group bacterium]
MIIKEKNTKESRKRRHKKIRTTLEGTSERPRISVHRSNKGVQVQLIDDQKGHTIALTSSIKDNKNPMEAAKDAGLRLAKEAKDKDIKEAVFDRGGFAYHGRVKMVAEGAREGGLQF